MVSQLRKQKRITARPVENWKTVGWQGITSRVPAGWNLVAFGGDHDAGSFRLDNGALDSGRVLGMEVRWAQAGRKFASKQIDQRLTSYLTSIEKSAQKQKVAAETDSESVDCDEADGRTDERVFSWRSDRKGAGRIWHCSTCGRVVIAQVVGGKSDDLATLELAAIGEMRCHRQDWENWCLYDLSTAIPTDFTLHAKPQLMNVYVQLSFNRGRSTDLLTVEQWGVAEVQLRGQNLKDWFDRKSDLASSGVGVRSTETEKDGHEAFSLSGRRGGITYWMGTALKQLFRLQKPATWYKGLLWHCPDSNKIFLVQLYSRTQDTGTLDEIVRRTVCH